MFGKKSQPLLTFRFRHFLNGITESGTRHVVGMLAEKVAQQVHATPLTHLTQHPADSLMHEVMRMVQVYLSISQAP